MRRFFVALTILVMLVSSCSSGVTRSTGTIPAGQLNMAQVKSILDTYTSPSEIEVEINHIYMGDGYITISNERNPSTGFVEIAGWLGENKVFYKEIGGNNHNLHGYGANSYYHQSYVRPIINPWWSLPLYVGYRTSPARVLIIQKERTVYRNTVSYKQQKVKNKTYQNKAKKKYGKKYKEAVKKAPKVRKNLSSAKKKSFKKTDVNKKVKSGGFGKTIQKKKNDVKNQKRSVTKPTPHNDK